jgi:replication factor A1
MSILDEIKVALKEADIGVKDKQIQDRLDTLKQFKISDGEVKRSILTHFGVTSKGGGGDNTIGPISDLSDGNWTSLKIKVVQLWESNHDSISQSGVVGDSTGTVKFTKWATANLPQMEEGKCYTLLNVVASVYNEKLQVALNKKSKIEELTEDVEVKDNTITFIGAFVSIQSNSGLITRCDECNKAIRGTCDKHPDAKGHYDVRIIGAIDNGQRYTSVIIDAEIVEKVTGFSVEYCKNMATEAMDKEVVISQLRSVLLGKFFYMSGSDMGDSILVKTMMPYVNSIPDKELKDLMQYIGK